MSYITHSNLPSFHSYTKDRYRIKIKLNKTRRDSKELTENNINGKNIIKTISRSNSKKIRVKKKYRNEKGTRETLWCSNPHSNEETSSRNKGALSEIKKEIVLSSKITKKQTIMIPNNKNIIKTTLIKVQSIKIYKVLKEEVFFKILSSAYRNDNVHKLLEFK